MSCKFELIWALTSDDASELEPQEASEKVY